jgi:large subunit ribosomal protein L35
MPKSKTNRGAKKRFKITANGKVLKFKAFGSHLMACKSSKKKMHMRGSTVVAPSDAGRFPRLLPNDQ